MVVDVLAVLGQPIPRHAVQFVAGRVIPGLAVDAVLSSLIEAHMIHFDRGTGLLSLTEIDRDYALSDLREYRAGERRVLERFTADYYATLRVAREAWRSFVDVEPQLLEVEHRTRADDVAGAFEVLAAIDLEFVVWTGRIGRVQAIQQGLKGNVDHPRYQAILFFGVGQVHAFVGPLSLAAERLVTARALASATGEVDLARRAGAWLGDVYRRQGRLRESVQLLEEAAAIYRNDDIPLRDTCPLMLSLALSYAGRAADAIWWAERLRTLVERFGQNNVYRGQVEDALALAYLIGNRPEEAADHAQAAIVAYRTLDAGDPMAYVENVLGMALVLLRRMEEALARFDEARQDARDHASPRAEGFAAFNQARTFHMTGEPVKALEAALAASDLLSRVGAPEAEAAHALLRALESRQSGNRKRETEMLRACAHLCRNFAELLPAEDLLHDGDTSPGGDGLTGALGL